MAAPRIPCLALLLATACAPPPGEVLARGTIRASLELASPDTLEGVRLVVENTDRAPIRILAPGDGSLARARSPVLAWSVRPDDAPGDLPAALPDTDLRCGNVNPLRRDEVHELAPGESVVFDAWLQPPRLAPGSHRVALHFASVPDVELGGLPLGPHDPEALELLRASTACSAWTPEVRIQVPPDQHR